MTRRNSNINNKIILDWMKFQQNQKLNSANVDIINNFSDAMSTNNGASTMASEALEAAKPIIKNQFDAFDKAIPDRWISKEDKENIWKPTIKNIMHDELNYSQFVRRNTAGANNLLIGIDNYVQSKNEKLTKAIYEGIKIDIKVIGQMNLRTSKLNTSLPGNLVLELKQHKVSDIATFTGKSDLDVWRKIDSINTSRKEIIYSKEQIKEIGFWKGNFFGSSAERSNYKSFNNIIKTEEKNIINIQHEFRDAIIENICLSPINKNEKDRTNFADDKFNERAILTAKTEKDIEDYRNKPENSNLPQFIFDKEIDRHHLLDDSLVQETENIQEVHEIQ